MKYLIQDFSGGLTDSPFTSPDGHAEIIDNFLIKKDRSLETAPGMAPLNLRIPSGAQIETLAELGSSMVAFTADRAYLITGDSAYTEILGPTGNKAFNRPGRASVSTSNNQLLVTNSGHAYPIKIFTDGSNVTRLVTAGLPRPSGSVTHTPSTAGSNNFLYAIVYHYSYQVGPTTFEDYSAPLTFSVSNGHSSANTLSSLPVISNGTDYNWDTATITKRIYRTVNNGTAFYYLGSVSNATTSYAYTGKTDAVIQTEETLYINGGILPNDMPPASKYALLANDTAYYLSTEGAPYRLYQATTNDFDSVPEGSFSDTSGSITGGGTVGRSPIVFTDRSTLRIEGLIDELGRGSILREVISNTVGCVSHASIVGTSRGIYFAGNDAFYFTDGYSTPTKLAKKDASTSKIDSIYQGLEQTHDIQGVYDVLNTRVLWVVPGNATIFVYDETHDSFTTISSTDNILPTCLLYRNGAVYIGDAQGYLYKMSDEYFTHPVVDTSTTPDNWNETPIIHRWKSSALTFGDGSINKWITKINVQGMPTTPVDLAIQSYTNGGDDHKALQPLRISPSFTWGDTGLTWGDATLIWSRTSILNQTRRFPHGRLRARQRQIEFTNHYSVIAGSVEDTDSMATVNAGLKIVTLLNPSIYSFGTNNEGYSLHIGGEAYTILSGTEDTLTLDDPSGTLQNGVYDWQIKGYSKGQRAHIINFSVEYEPLSDAGTWWRA